MLSLAEEKYGVNGLRFHAFKGGALFSPLKAGKLRLVRKEMAGLLKPATNRDVSSGAEKDGLL